MQETLKQGRKTQWQMKVAEGTADLKKEVREKTEKDLIESFAIRTSWSVTRVRGRYLRS